MNITLKSVKHNERLSRDSHCFTATLYLDGKKVFGVMDDGWGGEMETFHINGGVDNVNDMYHTINKELGKEKCKPPYETMDNQLEFVVGDLVNAFLRDREIKKSLRKITYMVGNDMYTVKAKPTAENIAKVKACTWWNHTNVLLNTMPIEEVRQYFN